MKPNMTDMEREVYEHIKIGNSDGVFEVLSKHGKNEGESLPTFILAQAFEYNRLDLARTLMNKYKFEDLNDKQNPVTAFESPYGHNPIITHAARYGTREDFEKLIELGADINAWSHVRNSAVGRALAFENYQAIYDLIDLGFDMKTNSGGEALRSAAWKGHFEFVKLFIQHGADVNFNGANQVLPYCTTPVQMAASSNHFEIVKYLVEHGADVTLRDKYGNRAYLEAKRNKNIEMMDYIKKLEPSIWHEADKRVAELKKMGLPIEICKWLGTENRRIDLPDTCPAEYIEFETIFDVRPIEWYGRIFLDLTKEVEGFESTGFVIWIPDQKCLGSLDVEHDELFVFKGVKWNKFIKRLPVVVNHVLEGLPIDELYK